MINLKIYAMILLQLPVVTDYEGIGVQSLLITAIITLTSSVIFLYRNKEKVLKKQNEIHALIIKEKDAQIRAVVKDHQDDLKAENQTLKEVMDKYNQFTQSIKEIYSNKL
jgi:seryl-tRNA synthetase